MKEQKQALLQLLTSDDLAELQVKSNHNFNIFQALKLQNNEVKHSNFLGWLLTPFESHNLMDTFLKELLKVALKNDTILVDIILKDLTDAKVSLEKMANDGRRMDIFIDCPRNKLFCVIENKVWSGEGCNQLEDYRNYVLNHDKYKDYKYKIFLFLTPYKYSPCEDYKGYIRINYGDILKAINNLMKQCGCLLDDDIKIFIEHYIKMVERNIMDETDKEIIDLCRKIYHKNKTAIDLINKYREKSKEEIYEVLTKLINNDENLCPETSNVNWIRFIPNEAKFPSLEIAIEDWVQSKNLLTFEIVNKQNSVDIDIVIRRVEESNDDKRKILLNIAKNKFNYKPPKKKDTYDHVKSVSLIKPDVYDEIILKSYDELSEYLKNKIEETGIINDFIQLAQEFDKQINYK